MDLKAESSQMLDDDDDPENRYRDVFMLFHHTAVFRGKKTSQACK